MTTSNFFTHSTKFFYLQNPATHICWRFILMCHLVLNFGHLITVGLVHPNAMQFICFGITLFLNTWYSINSNSPLENLMRVLVHVINMQFGIHSKDSEYQPLVMVHSLAFGGRGCFFSSGRLRKCRIFNSTLGYPGEGPKKKR